jgi:hypothetical protein
VLERMLRDHRAGQAEARSAPGIGAMLLFLMVDV